MMNPQLITNPKLLSKICTLVNTHSSSSSLELELRLHKYGSSKDDNGIKLEDFNRLKNKLFENYGQPEVIHSTDLIKNNDRQTIQTTDDSEKFFMIKKNPVYNNTESKFNSDEDLKKIGNDLYYNYGIKVSVALETEEIPSSERLENPTLIRHKHRYSWKLDSYGFRFDLTEVKQESSESITEKYEVEIEAILPEYLSKNSRFTGGDKAKIKDFAQKIDNLDQAAMFCIKTLHDSDNFYGFAQQKEIAEFFNNKLNYKKYIAIEKGIKDINSVYPLKAGILASEVVVQARGLKRYDLKYGGLIGGKVSYTVTPKAEGLRKFLVIHPNGVWLLGTTSGANSFNLIYPSKTLEFNHWMPYVNTILDGEDIPVDNEDEKHRKGNYLDILHFYLPFDVLVIKGQDIRYKNLLERQTYIRIIKNIGRQPDDKVLIIQEKPFYLLSNKPEETYSIIEKTLNNLKSLPYESDGLIFTPNGIYNPQTEAILKHKRNAGGRSLDKYEDICKWKPLDKISIDLKFISSTKGNKFYSSKGPENVEFNGSFRYFFDPETQVDWYNPIFSKIKNGDIVELALKNYDENNKVILKPLRIRYDKKFANGTRTAISTWEDINEPILEDTITGKNTALMYKYHNAAKLSVLEENPLVKNGSHLIDIGSGKGGDLSKFTKFSKLLLIEPDPQNLAELKRRLSQNRDIYSKKYSVIQAGGEDSQRILAEAKELFGEEFGKKPLYISMMLSLSFFWKSQNFLKQLVNTINLLKEAYYKAGGQDMNFLYMTIEGERTYKLLTEHNNFIKLNDISISYYPEKELVHLSFPENTIVKEQDEYLVNLEQLYNLTGMESLYQEEANKEKFLSEAEKTLSSLYVYGQAKITNSPFVIYERESETEIPKIPETKTISSYIETISDKSPKISPSKGEIQELMELTTAVKIKDISEGPEFYIPSKSNSTLFEVIIKYFNPEVDSIPYDEVVKFRNQIALSVKEKNPFDLKEQTIFESAGRGLIKRLSKDEDDAISWIASDNELKPKYIAWLPDVIGYNLKVNQTLYPTSIQNENVETIELVYENKSYKLKLKK